MYKSHVVTGRIIEIQENKVLTQQGDVLCTYHSRYYMLPPQEMGQESDVSPIDAPLITRQNERENEDVKKSWLPIKPWFSLHKKSANRV